MIKSKKKDLLTKLKSYTQQIIGVDLQIEEADHHTTDLLPIFMSDTYKFCHVNWMGHDVLLCMSTDSADLSPGKISKHMEIVNKRTGMTAVFVTDEMKSYNIQRMINSRTDFMIPGKQMFIPSLLLDIRPIKQKNVDLGITVPPIAQCIVLYHLEVVSLQGKMLKELQELFMVSYATIDRAVRWLEKQELITRNEGRISFFLNGIDLWKKAVSILSSPIEKIVYTTSAIDHPTLSGNSAMAEYTMMNEDGMLHVAMTRQQMKQLGETHTVEDGTVVEIWRYSPELLSNNGVVDKLSLYLSLKDDKDERIQMELENLINEIK